MRLVKGVVYVPKNINTQQNILARNIAMMPNIINNNKDNMLPIYQNSCLEIIADTVTSAIIGDLPNEPRNFIIPENLVDDNLKVLLDKVDLGKGLRNKVRKHMHTLNSEYINPDDIIDEVNQVGLPEF